MVSYEQGWPYPPINSVGPWELNETDLIEKLADRFIRYGRMGMHVGDFDDGVPYMMEAVRALDYKAQYKACEAFYKLSKGFDWGDRLMFQRFEESFTIIDAENLEEHFVELHWA